LDRGRTSRPPRGGGPHRTCLSPKSGYFNPLHLPDSPSVKPGCLISIGTSLTTSTRAGILHTTRLLEYIRREYVLALSLPSCRVWGPVFTIPKAEPVVRYPAPPLKRWLAWGALGLPHRLTNDELVRACSTLGTALPPSSGSWYQPPLSMVWGCA